MARLAAGASLKIPAPFVRLRYYITMITEAHLAQTLPPPNAARQRRRPE